MASFLRRFDGETYALMRIMAGLLFLCHGTQKLFGFPVAMPPGVPASIIIWVGGTIELAGGVLITLGCFTRWAAFVCSGEMAVAYWTAHGPRAFIPLVNQGELAVLYCFVFLFIAAHGAGRWSVDAARSRTAA